jgi:uncharacterized SAM-binding protein YcdF (DUF218 family)
VARFRSSFFKLLFALVVASAVLAATHPWWLQALGSALVNAEDPAPADLVVVLAGDWHGNRVLHGAELVRQGYAPKALVSGVDRGYYGVSECEMAIAFAVKKGYPQEFFIAAPHKSHSTREEAEALAGKLRAMGVRRFLLVTSDYHTARAARLFRPRIRDLEMKVVAAPDEFFRTDGWWKIREGRKRFLLEWTKTLTGFFGI